MLNGPVAWDERLRYQRHNEALSRRCLMQFGRGVGFCAEYLGLIKRALWCLQNRYQLVLGKGQPVGISVCSGWSDYFKPFCGTVDAPFLSLMNRHVLPYSRRIPPIRYLTQRTLSHLTGCERFMFNTYVSPERIVVPELGIDLDYPEALSYIDRLLWVPNDSVQNSINEWRERLGLPKEYLGIHIRRGDKITESPYTPISHYVRAISSLENPPKAMFVSSDDHGVVDELEKALPGEFRLIPGAVPTDRGHDQKTFNSWPATQRFSATVRFLAELTVQRESKYFIGASPSNIYYLIRWQRGQSGILDASSF